MSDSTPLDYLYLGQPYSNNMDFNYESALAGVARLTNMAITVYSPIVHYHAVAQAYSLPTDALYWTLANRTMLWHSRGIIVFRLPGWEESTGLTAERRWAKEWKKPVFYLSELLDLGAD